VTPEPARFGDADRYKARVGHCNRRFAELVPPPPETGDFPQSELFERGAKLAIELPNVKYDQVMKTQRL
jgi:hypothetical protein